MEKLCKKILASVLLVVVVLTFTPVSTAHAEGFTGLAAASDGNWYYYNEGNLDSQFTGFVEFNGMWWLVYNGAVAFNYTGLWNDPALGWWYVENGAINFGYNGLIPYGDAWWCVAGGRVVFDYTGLWCDPYVGWWFVQNGTINFNYNGLIPYGDAWWCVAGGRVVFDYTGLWCDPYVGWWFVQNGIINFNYTGFVDYGGAKWYVVNGSVAFNYSGNITMDGVSYTVVNGMITGSSTTQPDNNTPGSGDTSFIPITGELTAGTICMIRSSNNPDYALTVVEDVTAQGGYNLVMSKLIGSEAQKFMVIHTDAGYGFLSMKYYTKNGTNPDGKWLINAYNGGWDNSSSDGSDNVQVTSNTTGGAMAWILEEVSTGVYNLRVSRDDYKLYLNVPGVITEGTNVQAGNSQLPLNVSFVSPYKKTLENGIYSISLPNNSDKALAIADASVKDFAALTVMPKTADNDQYFRLTCIDETNGLYTICNINSLRYLHNQGSNEIGDSITQIRFIDQRDLYWYFQQKPDGTYNIINANNNQLLTATSTAVVQSTGNDSSEQTFEVKPIINVDASLSTGIYSMGGQNYQISHIGNGVYTLNSIGKGYVTASADAVTYSATENSIACKWILSKSNDKFIIQSMVTNKYLTADCQLSQSSQAVSISDASSSVTNYAARYNLSALETLSDSKYSNIQVVKRMNTLGLNKDALMDPIAAANAVESSITTELSTLPTSVINFTGDTVSELNRFMKKNQGNIIRLTNDIKIQYDATYNDIGQVRIPSNVILDGNGHKLVAATDDIPTTGIAFFYNDDNNNYQEVISSNCGVINLTSDIAFEHNTLNVYGADKILVEGNNFTNAGLNAILINDKDKGATSVGIIRNNILGNTKGDTLGIYGNNDKLLIANNTVTNSGEYGIIVSCLRTETPIRVELETDGPHDIIVKGNDVSGTTKCAMYYLGAYQVYVTGNTLHDSKLEGVCFDSGCIGCYFANNTVYNTSTQGGLPGVSIDNGIYNIVDNNNVYDNGSAGIKIVRAGYGNVIVNNVCHDNNKHVFDERGNIGIGIEVSPVDPVKEPEYVSILDATGSDANVVYNNTVSGSHYESIAISKDAENGRNINNVVKYNTVSASKGHATVDYSTWNNTMNSNIVK